MERSYYAIIPANIRYDDEVTPNAKLLYGEITALCNEKGYCWATNDYFAQLYNVSKVSVSKWVNQLTERGYIRSQIVYKEGSKEIANRYLTLNVPPIKENFNTPLTKVNDPIKEKFNTPIKEKFKDNNTLFNNTFNTTLEIKRESNDDESSPTLKTKKEVRHKYGEYNHVRLTDTEYNKLIEEFGEDKTLLYIKKVDEYVEQTGKKYKNHYLTIRNWINKDKDNKQPSKTVTYRKENKATDYEGQRQYDYDNLEDQFLSKYQNE